MPLSQATPSEATNIVPTAPPAFVCRLDDTPACVPSHNYLSALLPSCLKRAPPRLVAHATSVCVR